MISVFSLENKRLLITGASSGIGRAVAQECATAGAVCTITARDEDRLKQTYGTLHGSGHRIITSDLTQNKRIKALVSDIDALDGVVCCAGVVETKMLKFTEDVDINQVFEINAFSAMKLVRELMQNRKLKKGASIVLISSISGVKCGYIGGTIYGASKGALEGFAKAAALELAPKKIRVNTIVPGMIATPLLKDSQIDEEILTADMQKYPLKRYGEPQEVAYAALYLLSDAARWITGASLLIDGGYTLN